jgi:hypothetical protein
MMPRNSAEYAALWREQVDTKELTELQAMATKIRRTARRRWLLDHLWGILAAVMTCLAVLLDPAPLLIKLCLALLLVGPMWFVWRRRQVAEAARAIAIDDPKVFFEASIGNMRAEINLSTLSAWSMAPIFIAGCLLGGAAHGFDRLYIAFRDMFTLASVKLTLIGVITILTFIYFIRDNIKLREQLRRLEAMRREWDERAPGEEP